jgi:hypothetical protein
VFDLLLALLAAVGVFFRRRADTSLEILALRQQLAVLKRKRPRPAVSRLDRAFWIFLRRVWSRWADTLVIVQSDTVVRWHRAGFRLYWRWRSRPQAGRKVAEEIRALIRRVAAENVDWGAPKIHGELLKLGSRFPNVRSPDICDGSERRGDPRKRWLAFLQNHREVIAAIDFFTVPTLTFKFLDCFFVIEHRRRKVLHFNVTSSPTSEWVVQQLREAFSDACPYRHVILDHDSKFNGDVITWLKQQACSRSGRGFRHPGRMESLSVGSEAAAARSSTMSLHWTNDFCDGSFALYVNYHHEDRIHDALGKDTPNRRRVETKPSSTATLVSSPRLGDLAHRYSWRAAA